MGYLICDNCGGYYELQKGESTEDFESCECGGKLKYVETINGLIKQDDTNLNKVSTKEKINDPKEIKYSFWTGKPIKTSEEINDLKKFKEKGESKKLKLSLKGWWSSKNKQTKTSIYFIAGIVFVSILTIMTLMTLVSFSPERSPNSAEYVSIANNTTPSSVSPSASNSSSSAQTSSKSQFPLELPEGEKVSCPICHSFNVLVTSEEKYNDKYIDALKCNNCGHQWAETFSKSALSP